MSTISHYIKSHPVNKFTNVPNRIKQHIFALFFKLHLLFNPCKVTNDPISQSPAFPLHPILNSIEIRSSPANSSCASSIVKQLISYKAKIQDGKSTLCSFRLSSCHASSFLLSHNICYFVCFISLLTITQNQTG